MRREDLTRAQRWYIADRLAAERLPMIDQQCEYVVPADGFYVRYGKRALDVLVSSVALVVTAPLNAVLAIGTLVDVGRPLLFKQQRTGKGGKLFKLVKFRNMRNTTDERGELLPASQRVTMFGKFIRRTSLDELLNFWPVLKGEMSIIGPRPLPPEYEHRYSKRHWMRLSVRPGLECPPRGDLGHVWTWQEQFENDVWYVEHVSFGTDLMMFTNLVRFAFDRKSTEARAGVSKKGVFMGYDLDGNAINLDGVPQEYLDDSNLEKIEEVHGQI